MCVINQAPTHLARNVRERRLGKRPTPFQYVVQRAGVHQLETNRDLTLFEERAIKVDEKRARRLVQRANFLHQLVPLVFLKHVNHLERHQHARVPIARLLHIRRCTLAENLEQLELVSLERERRRLVVAAAGAAGGLLLQTSIVNHDLPVLKLASRIAVQDDGKGG